MRKISLIVLTSILLYSCSGSTGRYTQEVMLSKNIASAESGAIAVSIPNNWYVVNNNVNPYTDILLIEDGMRASIIFNPFNMHNYFLYHPELSLLENALKYSKIFRKEETDGDFKQVNIDEYFNAGNIKCGAYEYTVDNGQRNRVVLFQYNDFLYECTALPSPDKQFDTNSLFTIQNSVIASVK